MLFLGFLLIASCLGQWHYERQYTSSDCNETVYIKLTTFVGDTCAEVTTCTEEPASSGRWVLRACDKPGNYYAPPSARPIYTETTYQTGSSCGIIESDIIFVADVCIPNADGASGIKITSDCSQLQSFATVDCSDAATETPTAVGRTCNAGTTVVGVCQTAAGPVHPTAADIIASTDDSNVQQAITDFFSTTAPNGVPDFSGAPASADANDLVSWAFAVSYTDPLDNGQIVTQENDLATFLAEQLNVYGIDVTASITPNVPKRGVQQNAYLVQTSIQGAPEAPLAPEPEQGPEPEPQPEEPAPEPEPVPEPEEPAPEPQPEEPAPEPQEPQPEEPAPEPEEPAPEPEEPVPEPEEPQPVPEPEQEPVPEPEEPAPEPERTVLDDLFDKMVDPAVENQVSTAIAGLTPSGSTTFGPPTINRDENHVSWPIVIVYTTALTTDEQVAITADVTGIVAQALGVDVSRVAVDLAFISTTDKRAVQATTYQATSVVSGTTQMIASALMSLVFLVLFI